MSHIAIIGGGNMGYALASGLAHGDTGHTVTVADPVDSQLNRFESLSVATTSDNRAAVASANVAVLAVKPQIIQSVCRELHDSLTGCFVVSIAAGTRLDRLGQWLPEETSCIRAMPNTPALVGLGVTGLAANRHASDEHRKLAETVFEGCGHVLWFDDDDQLDVVTAISGSGPAYYFYVIEHLVKVGQRLGLTREQAHILASRTALGASSMACVEGANPSQLRENVTSPGGTTEAALQYLGEAKAGELFQQAAERALQRARELGTLED